MIRWLMIVLLAASISICSIIGYCYIHILIRQHHMNVGGLLCLAGLGYFAWLLFKYLRLKRAGGSVVLSKLI